MIEMGEQKEGETLNSRHGNSVFVCGKEAVEYRIILPPTDSVNDFEL